MFCRELLHQVEFDYLQHFSGLCIFVLQRRAASDRFFDEPVGFPVEVTRESLERNVLGSVPYLWALVAFSNGGQVHDTALFGLLAGRPYMILKTFH